MTMCVVCKEHKEDEEFNWKNKSTLTRKNYCRTCDRAIKKRHYDNNREKIIQETRERNAARKEEFLEWKRTLKCSRCGESEECCLDFHHPDPTLKEGTVAYLISRGSFKKAVEEAAKCIVLCANCHRKFHAGVVFNG